MSDEKMARFTLDFVDAPLHEVLDSIVAQMDDYTWKIKDDVVNIFPTRRRDPQIEKLLRMPVSKFYFAAGDTGGDTQAHIMLFFQSFYNSLKRSTLRQRP